jgi:4-alpha-glucanotransferase
LESQRAKAYVVGEDLGTVEDGVREHLAEAGVLSYRLVWFEDVPPAEFPVQALAAVTTHDLPTIAGLLTGEDEAELRELGLPVNDEGTDELVDRLRSAAGSVEAAGGDDAALDELVVGVHRALAASPSMLVTATIEDALGVTRRPNVPGTTSERPNWSIPLPKHEEDIETDDRVAAVVAALQERSAPVVDP